MASIGPVSDWQVSAARPATADIASSAWFVQDAPIHDIMMSILIIVASLRVFEAADDLCSCSP